MSWNAHELDALLTQDVDDVVDRARSVGAGDRTVALRDCVTRLETCAEPLDRLRVLLFIQTLLALAPDATVSSSVAESAAQQLAMVVVSTTEPDELRQPALDALALLFAKAKELTASTDSRLREAFNVAGRSHNPEIRDFARRVSLANAVVARSA
jgi:hypothetical protein